MQREREGGERERTAKANLKSHLNCPSQRARESERERERKRERERT